ncbi:hypothetical protein Celaphus_00011246 [Cervus elaphus hippelaphus]|uniref:Uncharacterized protein n=1 Tax=Cervus elaphus hippelaphus TaxID=46360 RepID=A0A212CR84_CEREH|nr:hypothetical protein Celaphus_00011246 [Cervus elaphus hippelaphus]
MNILQLQRRNMATMWNSFQIRQLLAL